METEHQRRLRLGNQYKELSEIVRFSYYAEGFGATRDRYERPKPARIKTNKLQEGKATTTWNYFLCQLGITEVPDSTHTMLTRPPCEKCAVDIIVEAYKELENLQMVGPTSYRDYDWLSNGLKACGWICELMLRWATNQLLKKKGEQQSMQ
jgi:hypothetical protein